VRHDTRLTDNRDPAGMSQTMPNAAGLPTPTDAPFSHHSPGVDVDIFWLERLGAAAS
jgi:hypothetical protein